MTDKNPTDPLVTAAIVAANRKHRSNECVTTLLVRNSEMEEKILRVTGHGDSAYFQWQDGAQGPLGERFKQASAGWAILKYASSTVEEKPVSMISAADVARLHQHSSTDCVTILQTKSVENGDDEEEIELRVCGTGDNAYFEWIDELGDATGDAFTQIAAGTEGTAAPVASMGDSLREVVSAAETAPRPPRP